MPQLPSEEIRTREVLEWRGLHLLHFAGSSCSQKTRIFLNMKRIPWVSHPVNLATQKNYSPWFLGINPRGLVPVLVDDGAVIIESNDILTYLDEKFPEPALIPAGQTDQATRLLQDEDDLHIDLRALTMRFLFPAFLVQKKPAALTAYAQDRGLIDGEPDPHKNIELHFWREFARHGVTDAQATRAAKNFRSRLESLDVTLAQQPYLLGSTISVVDIAWYIYAHRLIAGGYPLARLHPHVRKWYDLLHARPEFRKEVAEPGPIRWLRQGLHLVQKLRGSTIPKVVGL
jgi:glutathione S-transferase